MATTTIFLPLTTTFSAPVACSSQFVIPGAAVNRAMYAYDPGQQGKDPSALQCAPDQAISWWGQDAATTSTGIGGSTFICPEQFTTAAVINEPTRTLIACCPSAYAFVVLMSHAAPGQCKSTLKPGTLTFIAAGTNGLYSKTSSFLETSSVIFAAQINGYMTPGTASSTSTGTGTLTSSSTGSTTASATGSGSATSTPPSEPSGLPTGAKAGIGAGAGALAILALLGAFLWYRRRHRYKAVALPVGGTQVGAYYPPAENKGSGQQFDGSQTEAPPGGYYQPKRDQAPQEVSAVPYRPSELA